MLALFKEVFVPLVSLFIFILGTGFFSTLLAIKMTLNDAPTLMIGAMTGVYYAGLVLGTFRMDRFITRVGHIRAYAAFSSCLAIICLLHGLFYELSFWLVLRFVAGLASAGLYVVIESWLLCKSTKINRGQILALYMISFYGAQSLGQFFLNMGDPQTLLLFAIPSMMCSLSIIPLSMASISSPQLTEISTLSFKKLFNKSAPGLLGAFSSGLMMGVIYGLMPTFLTDVFSTKAEVATYMFAIIFGGMLLQYPVGRLSDTFERRLVLIVLCFATIAVSVALMASATNHVLFFILMVLFGGLTFTLYPISISYACDSLATRDIVAGTQSLLLAYSIGAMAGPFIAPLFMHTLGNHGLFIYFSSVCGFIIPMLILRKSPRLELPDETLLTIPQATPILFGNEDSGFR